MCPVLGVRLVVVSGVIVPPIRSSRTVISCPETTSPEVGDTISSFAVERGRIAAIVGRSFGGTTIAATTKTPDRPTSPNPAGRGMRRNDRPRIRDTPVNQDRPAQI